MTEQFDQVQTTQATTTTILDPFSTSIIRGWADGQTTVPVADRPGPAQLDQFTVSVIRSWGDVSGTTAPPAARYNPQGSSQLDVPPAFPHAETPAMAALPKDKIKDYPVTNGVLEISYKDLAKMPGLPTTSQPYSILRIKDKPANVHVKHWADQSGYYFFFTDSASSTPYHYPSNLKVIEMDGRRFDVDRSRLKVNEYLLAQSAGSQTDNGFSTIKNPKVDGITYFMRMSRLSKQALEFEENLLRKGAANSKNPYFHIYLADVLTMESLQPLIRGVVQGQVTPEQKQAILDKLNEAQKELKTAETLSSGPLQKVNKFPQGNVVMSLDPGAFYRTPAPGTVYDPFFLYWGGAWDQAVRREVAVTFISGLIANDAYRYFQLPPDLPPG